MNCLLAAATTQEIEPCLDHYRRGEIANMDVLITGIGLTAAMYSLTKQVHLKKPGVIIQAGIAGCFDKNIPLGSVVVVAKDTIADQSLVEHKELKTMFDLGLIKPNQPPFSRGWLANPHKQLIKQTKLKPVSAVSVNHVTTSRQITGLYRQKFNAAIESMEGAALHYVCILEKIPFLQVRGISNYIGERDKKKWKMKEAIINLNIELTRITHGFCHPASNIHHL